MSNRTISDGKEMRQRWDALIAAMEKENIDCLLMYSTDRIFSAYLRYVTDYPTGLQPMAGLFSKEGISLVGHGVRGVPLYPPPIKEQKKGEFQYLAGGMAQHDFVKDLVGLPVCATIRDLAHLWPEAISELIKKYGYKRIGLVGPSMIPISFNDYFIANMPELEFVDATSLVDDIKTVKSPYEIKQAQDCVWLIDEIMAAAPSVMKVGQTLREVGRKLRALADGKDSLDLSIMLGKHPTMPIFSEWNHTDEEILTPEDSIVLMVEISSNVGLWGECARVYSMGEPPTSLVDIVELNFSMQDYLASLIVPGAIPSEVFEKYSACLVENGFPPEKRYCAHGQGFDIIEYPLIRPEISIPLVENSFIAIHPSMYDPTRSTGCFLCDNYLITKDGAKIMSKTPREIILVYNQ
jgi:Xaa-Pro aminopeptidase